jgi:GT2 family glycosyltransferase
MKDLSIIIVSYNTADITVAAIQSVIDTVKKITCEIIVVDNASKDESVKKINALKNTNKNITAISVIENKENFGFSKANNIGVEKSSGRYVLFLNSDTVVHKETLDGMVEWMDKNPKVGASTCKVVFPNGKLDDGSHRGFPTPLRSLFHFTGLAKLFPNSEFFNGYHLGWKNLDKVHEIEALVGAFMVVRREAGDEVKWWDEDYFWYGEDLDFCYVLNEKGWKIYYIPDYSILHYKGVSGGIKKNTAVVSQASKETKLRATNARFNAMRIFYKKHYEKKYPQIITQLVFLGIDIKMKMVKRQMGI